MKSESERVALNSINYYGRMNPKKLRATFVINDDMTVVYASVRLPVVASFMKSTQWKPDLQFPRTFCGKHFFSFCLKLMNADKKITHSFTWLAVCIETLCLLSNFHSVTGSPLGWIQYSQRPPVRRPYWLPVSWPPLPAVCRRKSWSFCLVWLSPGTLPPRGDMSWTWSCTDKRWTINMKKKESLIINPSN